MTPLKTGSVTTATGEACVLVCAMTPRNMGVAFMRIGRTWLPRHVPGNRLPPCTQSCIWLGRRLYWLPLNHDNELLLHSIISKRSCAKLNTGPPSCVTLLSRVSLPICLLCVETINEFYCISYLTK